MNRLLIIDGHNLHFQIFFGIRARLKKKPGKVSPFGIGFTGAVKRIIRCAEPTHVVVIFDGEHENPRRALYPPYKANRPDYSLLPDDENPYLQLPAVYEALERLGIKYVETTSVEADDLIAVCTERFRPAADIIVCSHDHDFYQLLGQHVKLMNYSGKQASYYDDRNFREEFHISPRRYADYKALNGDKSDNIPGVRGIGAITAVRLLNRFGGIEGIIAHTDDIRQKKLRRCVVEGVDRMRLNYKLVKLGGEPYRSVEIPFTLAELAYTLPEKPPRRDAPASAPKAPAQDKKRRRRRPKKPTQEQAQLPGQAQVQSAEPPTAPSEAPAQVAPEAAVRADVPIGSASAPHKKKRRRRRSKKKNREQAQIPAQATEAGND